MMKISFLLELKQEPFGGGTQFLKALRKQFIQKGFYEFNPEKAKIILFNSFPFREENRFLQAFNLKRKNKILIHRVDGPIYKIRNKDYEVDKIIYKFNELIADGTIFQSKWSRFENYKLGMERNKYEKVLINAPDSDIFNKKEDKEIFKGKEIKLIATSWSSNWNKGFDIYKYLDENLDFSKYSMTFIGNSPIKFKNIKWIKPLESEALATQLKQNDIFIIASKNDPCSNSLIEALHCGLPAIVLNDGGHPEIIGKNGLTFNGKEDIIEKIEEIVQNIEIYKNEWNLPNIEEISEKYYNFCKRIYDDFTDNIYSPKKIKMYHSLKLRFRVLKWKIKDIGFINFIFHRIFSQFKNIFKLIFAIPKYELIFKESCIKFKSTDINHKLWIYNLKSEIPLFLNKIKSNRRRGFFQYSFSGDLFSEKIKWGLANSVFFLKIVYTLNLEEKYKVEVKNAINFIQSFQRKDGFFYDPLIKVLSFPFRVFKAFKNLDFSYLRYKGQIRAETRQTISSLSLFNRETVINHKKIPNNENEIKKYLMSLNWEKPWEAGSHFSHLLFFLHYSNIKRKDELINYAINGVNKIQNENDGFWYKGNPSIQQKINGAMKIITGLKVVNKVNFQYARKMIDIVLSVKNDSQACDNFNIIYVLKNCNEIMKSKYRFNEIKDFAIRRLEVYYEYYFPKLGGFSFYKNHANSFYYDAFITKGKLEPDIHGTLMFLWGISIISQILGLNDKLNFKEFIT